MKKQTRENFLAAMFLAAVLGMLNYQESVENTNKMNTMAESTQLRRQPQTKQKVQHELVDYNVPDNEMVITEYTKIVTDEQEKQIIQYLEEEMIRLEKEQKKDKAKNTLKKKGDDDKKPKVNIHPTNLGRIPLPAVYENIADLLDPVHVKLFAKESPGEDDEDSENKDKKKSEEPAIEPEIPFFWHIPRAGGTTFQDIMTGCLDLTAASEVGAQYGHAEDEAVNVIRVPGRGKYLNIDTTTMAGIERAKRLSAVESGLADVVASPGLFAASTLFTPMNKGRMFVMFRDPIERQVSLFYHEKTYRPELAIFELQDYAKTKFIENNFMVRSLTNNFEGYLTVEDLQVAKEVLRRKCLVGLLREKETSMKRFEKFFGWDYLASKPGAEECTEKIMSWGWPNKNTYPSLDPDSEAYRLLETKNALDIELYEYAKLLFVQQGLVLDLPAPLSLSLTNDRE